MSSRDTLFLYKFHFCYPGFPSWFEMCTVLSLLGLFKGFTLWVDLLPSRLKALVVPFQVTDMLHVQGIGGNLGARKQTQPMVKLTPFILTLVETVLLPLILQENAFPLLCGAFVAQVQTE